MEISVDNNLLLSINKDDIIKAINSIIEEIINENSDPSKANLIENQKMTNFNTKRVPSISIINYLERILKYTKMETSTLIITLIYIDKICEKNNFLFSNHLRKMSIFLLNYTNILFNFKV